MTAGGWGHACSSTFKTLMIGKRFVLLRKVKFILPEFGFDSGHKSHCHLFSLCPQEVSSILWLQSAQIIVSLAYIHLLPLPSHRPTAHHPASNQPSPHTTAPGGHPTIPQPPSKGAGQTNVRRKLHNVEIIS